MPHTEGLVLHPAVTVKRLRDGKLGFLGFPSAVRVGDQDGSIGAFVQCLESEGDAPLILNDRSTRAINELKRIGVIVPRVDDAGFKAAKADNYAAQLDLLSRGLKAHYDSFGLNVGYANMQDANILIVGEGLIAADIIKGLASLSIHSIATHPERSDLTTPTKLIVFASDGCNRQSARRWNQIALDNNIPFLLVAAWRYSVTVGPYIPEPRSGCVDCFFRRQLINAEFPEEHASLEAHDAQTKFEGGEILRNIAAGLCSNQIAKIALNLRQLVNPGEIIEYKALENVLARSTLAVDPLCPVCSNRDPVPIPDSYYRSTLLSQKPGGL